MCADVNSPSAALFRSGSGLSGLGDFNVLRRYSALLSPMAGAPTDDFSAEDSNIKKNDTNNGNDDKASCQPVPVIGQNTTESRALDSSKRPREADAPHTASGGDGEDNDDPSNPHRPSPKRIHYADLNAEARERANDTDTRYPAIGLITPVDNEITDFNPSLDLLQGKKLAGAGGARPGLDAPFLP